MVKAMYSGVAGLKAHQSKMDVIGNNIANVNTWGYKSMDTSFKESIYSMINSGSAGSTANGGYGGTNPSVVGYGSMVSAISANFTSGNQVPTGKNLDMYIDGTAFFAVGPMYGEGQAMSPSDISLSRVGDFTIVNGYLVDSNGRYVYGCSMENGGEIFEPGATTDVQVQTLPKPLPKASYSKGVYNVYGNGTADPTDTSKMNKYKYKAVNPNGAVPGPSEPGGGSPPLTGAALAAKVEEYNSNQMGNLGNAGHALYVVHPEDPNKVVRVEFDAKETDIARPIPDTTVTPPDSNGVVTTTTYKEGTDPKTVIVTITKVTPPDPNAEKEGPQFDEGRMVFNKETGGYDMIDGVSTLKPLKIPTTCSYYDDAGNPSIEKDIVFESFTIKNDGMIWATSTKSKRQYLLGCVGLVNVTNPGGMNKEGGPYYQMTDGSGSGTIVQPGGTTGTLMSGYLESANVDIATEFSTMITTQRGFQANSKIITVTDEMLQELVNMKR